MYDKRCLSKASFEVHFAVDLYLGDHLFVVAVVFFVRFLHAVVVLISAVVISVSSSETVVVFVAVFASAVVDVTLAACVSAER